LRSLLQAHLLSLTKKHARFDRASLFDVAQRLLVSLLHPEGVSRHEIGVSER